MISKLVIYETKPDNQELLQNDRNGFIINTCQRRIYISLTDRNLSPQWIKKENFEAYHHLLNVSCGLLSHFKGENEIVHQFKTHYLNYLKTKNTNPNLIIVFEKLLQDTKKVRSNHLIGVGQQTYSRMAKKIIKSTSSKTRVLISGSGKLSKDLLCHLEYDYDLTIYARNDLEVKKIKEKKKVKSINWNLSHELENFPIIINTIGTKDCLFDQSFFKNWKALHRDSSTFIDFGSPSPIKTSFTKDEKVFRLDDIFCETQYLQASEKEKLNLARIAINQLATKRYDYFKLKEKNWNQERNIPLEQEEAYSPLLKLG